MIASDSRGCRAAGHCWLQEGFKNLSIWHIFLGICTSPLRCLTVKLPLPYILPFFIAVLSPLNTADFSLVCHPASPVAIRFCLACTFPRGAVFACCPQLLQIFSCHMAESNRSAPRGTVPAGHLGFRANWRCFHCVATWLSNFSRYLLDLWGESLWLAWSWSSDSWAAAKPWWCLSGGVPVAVWGWAVTLAGSAINNQQLPICKIALMRQLQARTPNWCDAIAVAVHKALDSYPALERVILSRSLPKSGLPQETFPVYC